MGSCAKMVATGIVAFRSIMFVVDVTDAILDYIATADLANKGFQLHAAWLGEYSCLCDAVVHVL